MTETKANQWLRAAAQAVRRSVRFVGEKAQSSHVRLGVTGLTGAGKTVFTTALAHALIHAREEPAQLAFLDVANEGHIVGVEIEPLPGVPLFPVERNVALLTSSAPGWPEPTLALSGVRIALRFAPQGLWRHASPEAELKVDIVDYPGEWLVDLPLLDQDYRAWSLATWARLADSGNDDARALSRAWCAAADAAPSLDGLDARAAAYGRLMHELKGDRFGWAWLTPGRGLTWNETEWIKSGCAFFPLPPAALVPGPAYGALVQRYQRYIEALVKPFYLRHLSNLDRQIVLVDLLGALARGPASFHGMREALGKILEHFHYGGWQTLMPLLGRRIGRAMVAATKADLVTASQLTALRSLLRETVDLSVMPKLKDYQHAVEDRAHYFIGCLASIVSTEERIGKFGAVEVPVLQGRVLGAAEEQILVPSDVPPGLPTPARWPERGYKYYAFEPPDLSAYKQRAFPHLGLDKALQFLIGDKVT
jgi:predicted YcjX-like family ATPase